jgi:hypothetical protein
MAKNRLGAQLHPHLIWEFLLFGSCQLRRPDSCTWSFSAILQPTCQTVRLPCGGERSGLELLYIGYYFNEIYTG